MNVSDVSSHATDGHEDCFPIPSNFSIVNFDTAIETTVNQVLIALGSNYQADQHLLIALEAIEKMGTASFSSVFVNPDYTAIADQPKPDYHNQCATIKLTTAVPLTELIKNLKSIENHCQRQHQHPEIEPNKKQIPEPFQSPYSSHQTQQVSLDIDVLAIKILDDRVNNKQWQVIDKRYPFKHHEWVGIEALLGA